MAQVAMQEDSRLDDSQSLSSLFQAMTCVFTQLCSKNDDVRFVLFVFLCVRCSENPNTIDSREDMPKFFCLSAASRYRDDETSIYALQKYDN